MTGSDGNTIFVLKSAFALKNVYYFSDSYSSIPIMIFNLKLWKYPTKIINKEKCQNIRKMLNGFIVLQIVLKKLAKN